MAITVNITRKNIDKLLDSGRIEVLINSSNWWVIRRNGVTKLWKSVKNRDRIRIPFKAGIYCSGAITENDFDTSGKLMNHFRRIS